MVLTRQITTAFAALLIVFYCLFNLSFYLLVLKSNSLQHSRLLISIGLPRHIFHWRRDANSNHIGEMGKMSLS